MLPPHTCRAVLVAAFSSTSTPIVRSLAAVNPRSQAIATVRIESTLALIKWRSSVAKSALSVLFPPLSVRFPLLETATIAYDCASQRG